MSKKNLQLNYVNLLCSEASSLQALLKEYVNEKVRETKLLISFLEALLFKLRNEKCKIEYWIADKTVPTHTLNMINNWMGTWEPAIIIQFSTRNHFSTSWPVLIRTLNHSTCSTPNQVDFVDHMTNQMKWSLMFQTMLFCEWTNFFHFLLYTSYMSTKKKLMEQYMYMYMYMCISVVFS